MFPEIFLSQVADVYIIPVLDEQGFRALTSPEQEKLLRPLIEGAVVRIADGISQRLSPEGKAAFDTLTSRDGVVPEEWQGFWQQHLPEYETVVQGTLIAYQEELKSAFAAG